MRFEFFLKRFHFVLWLRVSYCCVGVRNKPEETQSFALFKKPFELGFNEVLVFVHKD